MRYRVHIKMRPGATKRYCHTIIDGRPAGIMEATPGERGWFWYQSEDDSNCPYHRLHTSVIDSMERDREDIVITTMNTVQQAIFYSIIENFQEASGAMESMTDSAGALSEAYDTYLNSAQAHIDQFKASFQALSANIVDSLTDSGVALTNINGEYRSTYDIMSDIAAKWDEMDNMRQAALATALSGTRYRFTPEENDII